MTSSRSRFTQEEADDIVRQRQAGTSIADLVRQYGRRRTIYRVLEYADGRLDRQQSLPQRAEMLEVLRRWDEGASVGRIRVESGRSTDWIDRVLRDSGRSRENRPNRAAPGDRVKHHAGYLLVHVAADDPYAGMCTGTGLVLEHRIVVARSLGRALTEWETVHHINGVRNDNRIENLQLRSGHHGMGVVARCCDCGSMNIEHAPLAGGVAAAG